MFAALMFDRLRIRAQDWKHTLIASVRRHSSQQIAPHFPHIDWTFRDATQAEQDGWTLYEADDLMQIGCITDCTEETPRFSCDQDAVQHVDQLARAGSRLHQRALKIHHDHCRLRQALGHSPTWPPHQISHESLAVLNPHLDPQDLQILQHRTRQFNDRHEPMIGDFVEFSPANRTALQISQLISSAQEVQLFHIVPFELQQHVEGIWSNGPTIPRHLLTDTGKVRSAEVRFWHHNLHHSRFVTARLPCKLWIASPEHLHFPSQSE